MTKSTITRERIQRIIRAIDSEAYDEQEIREWLSSDEIMELTRMALAAMDGEPVAYMVRRHDEHEGTGTLIHAEYLQRYQDRGDYHYTPLYRHAQPVPVVPDEIKKRLPEILRTGKANRWEIHDLAKICAMLAAAPQESNS
ncbi:TPA: hypothetical protein L9L91_003491 [Klebsiella pneumoniae]|uniref:hypothetical protein n=1 Tax=Klebsiella pneumoniae TaxID=573 RepID=UPI0020105300|nr:hypothetical protein [Klebsiella pneumoniae]HBR1593605.1 hypothetical protein [Klebsiella pneumoniae]